METHNNKGFTATSTLPPFTFFPLPLQFPPVTTGASVSEYSDTQLIFDNNGNRRPE